MQISFTISNSLAFIHLGIHSGRHASNMAFAFIDNTNQNQAKKFKKKKKKNNNKKPKKKKVKLTICKAEELEIKAAVWCLWQQA